MKLPPPLLQCHYWPEEVSTKANYLKGWVLLCGFVLFSSGEKGDVGSNRPPGDSHPPQHDRSQHPDQRRLRTYQPAHTRDQTPSRGGQTTKVSPVLSLLLHPLFVFSGSRDSCFSCVSLICSDFVSGVSIEKYCFFHW